MELPGQWDHLALDEPSKRQVLAWLNGAIEQHHAELKTKDAQLHAKELKIQALTKCPSVRNWHIRACRDASFFID